MPRAGDSVGHLAVLPPWPVPKRPETENDDSPATEKEKPKGIGETCQERDGDDGGEG
jgi:hypothetical protein